MHAAIFTSGPRHLAALTTIALLALNHQAFADATAYPWPRTNPAANTLAATSAPPPGFIRQPTRADSFADWLRGLPMKPKGSPVRLYNGAIKFRQDVHTAVVDIDVGKRDLQQCADAVMRLRAEWLRATGRTGQIGFDYTGGGHVTFARWSRGERPNPKGTRWSKRAGPDSSYTSFRRYMRNVFAYAGTYSLSRELKPVPRASLRIGDVFIKGGFPGHAVLVADLVKNPTTGERRFLLLQSYMPAQDIHVLKNPESTDHSPWYPANFKGALVTPEWTFPEGSLKRWQR